VLAVGIRELKAKLSDYIRRVQNGEVVLVTDRGRVVAEIRTPVSTVDLPPEVAGLRPLVERGVVTLGLPGRAEYPPSPVRSPPGTAAAILDEERAER
jgi:antitoxin (DNA-binding transcriptional repressor) of toxin-antitoxin stability system